MNFKKLLVQSLVWRGSYFFTLLLVNVFLSRYLQASVTGWVYYLSNILNLSWIILSISLESGFTYFASGKLIQAERLNWFQLVWTIVLTLFSFVIVFGYLHIETPLQGVS